VRLLRSGAHKHTVSDPPGKVPSQTKGSLFFEQRNQKTFVCWVPCKAEANARHVMTAKQQKFFASFFQKRSPFFL
jgi:hypothetical protein